MWVELPGDVNGKPKSCLGGGQPAYREIQATASLIRIHVAQNGRSLPTARLRDSPAGGEKQLGLLSLAFSKHLHGRLATLAAEHELGDVREPDDPFLPVRPTSWLAPLFPPAGLLEDVPHDRSMYGRDSGPHGACEVVLLLQEGGEKHRLLPTLEEHFGRQAAAGAGTKEREVRAAATHFQAEHESLRPS